MFFILAQERTHLTTNNCSEIYETLDECDDTEDTEDGDVYSDVDTEEESENCDEIQAPEADSVEYECVSSKEDFEEEEAVLEQLNTSISTTHTAVARV